ncbi:hypothetical protein DXG01_007728 [Tephrocybe rancida]|nr:hypothetical protein DXG01_007728 [Tephrocybe rancida]
MDTNVAMQNKFDLPDLMPATEPDVEKDATVVEEKDGQKKHSSIVGTGDGENSVPVGDYPEGGPRAWSVLLGVISIVADAGLAPSDGLSSSAALGMSYVPERVNPRFEYEGGIQMPTAFTTCDMLLLTRLRADFYIREYLNERYTSSQIRRAEGQYYQIFLTQGLGVGTAVGIMALAMGIAASGCGVGGAVHSIMLNQLFHGHVGFRNGVRASAGMLGGLLVIAILLMKPRLFPTSRKHGSTLRDLSVFLRDPPYVVVVIGKHDGAWQLVILNGAGTAGRVIPTLLVARMGVFNTIIPFVLISGLLVFCTSALKDAVGTIVFAILYGFFAGAHAGLLSPMISSLAKQDSEIGARLGICFTFTVRSYISAESGFGGLIGTPIAGALLSKGFIWWRPSIWSGLCIVTGGLCFVLTRMLVARKKGSSWL